MLHNVRSAPITASLGLNIHTQVGYGQQVRVVGDRTELGDWDAKKGAPLDWSAGDLWSATLHLPVGEELEFKFIVYDSDS